ncbi:MAG: hypothetical protein ACE5KM_00275 [Planctomycetaceae bacterium]
MAEPSIQVSSELAQQEKEKRSCPSSERNALDPETAEIVHPWAGGSAIPAKRRSAYSNRTDERARKGGAERDAATRCRTDFETWDVVELTAFIASPGGPDLASMDVLRTADRLGFR